MGKISISATWSKKPKNRKYFLKGMLFLNKIDGNCKNCIFFKKCLQKFKIKEKQKILHLKMFFFFVLFDIIWHFFQKIVKNNLRFKILRQPKSNLQSCLKHWKLNFNHIICCNFNHKNISSYCFTFKGLKMQHSEKFYIFSSLAK